MLSNTELIVLKLVNEKPAYAYEIEKQIEARKMRHWVKIGIASIYQVLERLYQKGYVGFDIEREGKAPERKRYYINEAGRSELKAAVKNLLIQMEWYYLDLNVAIEGSDILEFGELKECLTERLAKVRFSLQKANKEYLTQKSQKFTANSIIRSIILFREAEVKLLEEMLAELAHIIANNDLPEKRRWLENVFKSL